MATYQLADVLGQTITFNPSTDVLSAINLSAINLTLEQTTSGVRITAPLSATDQSLSPTGSVTLSGVTLTQLIPANFVVYGSGVVAIGDLAATTTADDNANSFDSTTTSLLPNLFTGDNLIMGLGGNDTINLLASASASNLMFGGAGADTITGGGGATTIYGGMGVVDTTDGADVINLGSNNVSVYANAGADNITFTTATATGKMAYVYSGVGADTVSSTGAAGFVYIDGGADADSISVLGATGSSTGSISKNVFGGLGGDTLNLTGTSALSIIYGGTGLVDSADGGDTITGGTGNMYIYANAGTDNVTLNSTTGSTSTVYLGIGSDSLSSSAVGGSYLIYGNAGGDTINLTGHTGDVTIYGGDGSVDSADSADTITLGGTGNALVYGNGGGDTFNTGSPAGVTTSIYGGVGNDIFNVNFTSASGTVYIKDYGNGSGDKINVTLVGGVAATALNLTRTSAGTTIRNGTGETLVLDNYSGGFTATTFTLGDGSLLLANFGGSAATLTAGTGSDKVFAGDNGDTIIASTGTDSITGGAGADTIRFAAADFTAADTVAGSTGTDILEFTAAGASITDSIFANKTGIETLKLGAVNFGSDTITLASAATSTGITTVNATAATSANIDAFSLGHAFTYTGSTGADTVLGSVYADTISGAAGVDSIFGGVGSDSLTGDAGNDIFVYNSNAAFISQEGGDTITDFNPGTSTTATDVLQFKADAGSYNLGNNDTNVAGAVITTVEAAGGVATELVILNTVGIATADITTSLNTMNSLVTAGKGVIDIFYDTTKGYAVVYYDSNGGTAGGQTLIANLSGITSLTDMTKFDFTDVTFV